MDRLWYIIISLFFIIDRFNEHIGKNGNLQADMNRNSKYRLNSLIRRKLVSYNKKTKGEANVPLVAEDQETQRNGPAPEPVVVEPSEITEITEE